MNFLKLKFVCIPLLFLQLLAPAGLAQERPKVGLVLSGGGARGLAHIGALKVIEAAGIVPDYITGTSMGSVIAALYSMGYSAEEISHLNATTNWTVLLSDEVALDNVLMEQKDTYGKSLLEIPMRNGKVELPSGLIEGQQISTFFSELTWDAAELESFDDLPIPYRSTAADIVNGEIIEFESGDLATAMRASMSIPSVFSPVVLDSMVLVVDGGVMRNFPVQEVINMGADIVIGVYTGYAAKTSPDDLQSLPEVLARTTIFYGVFDSEKQAELTDVLIIPNLDGYSPASFASSDSIERKGEIAAELKYDELKRLADSLNQLGPPPERIKLPEIDSVRISEVEVIGASNTTESFITSKMGIEPGSWVSKNSMRQGVEELLGTLYYHKITYRFQPGENGLKLVVDVKEKPQSYFRFAIHYDDFYDIGLVTGYSRLNLFIPNTRFNVRLDIAKFPRLLVDYYKYYGEDQSAILSLTFYGQRDKLPIYRLGERVGDFNHNYASLGIYARKSIDLQQQFGLGLFMENSVARPDKAISSIIPEWNFTRYGTISLAGSMFFNYNSLDDSYFPRKGSKFDIELKGIFLSDLLFKEVNDTIDYSSLDLEAKPYARLSLSYDYYKQFAPKWYLNPGFYTGLSSNAIVATDYFYVGGYKYNMRRNHVSFTGLGINEYPISNFIQAKLATRYHFRSIIYLDFIANWMVGGESILSMANNLVDYNEQVNFGLGAGASVKLPLGPMSLMLSTNTVDWNLKAYLNLGFTF